MENLTPAQQQLYDWLVEYISTNKHSPSIREMMKAMNLRSPAPIQSRLEKMRGKGYIDWTEGQARTLKILKNYNEGVTLSGKITTGGLIEPFSDEQEKLDFGSIFNSVNCFALKVIDDSMRENHITEGDYVIMKEINDDKEVKDGDIVVVTVEGYGTILKRIYFENKKVILKASNSNDEPMVVPLKQVEIQGVLQGICRLFK